MVSHRNPALSATALVLVLALVGGACSSSGGQSSGGTIRGPSVVVGEVSAGAPLAGASVTLTTAQGKPLPGVKPSTSLAAGAFAVEATNLPRNFRVVARDGALGGRLFTGKLEADVRGWSSTTGDLSVNVGTTLVAIYLSQHPGASLPVATAAVSKFLGVPPTRDFALDVSIGDALDITTEDTIVVARLRGEIDLANAKPIGSLVAGAVTNDATGVVLDLTDTTYLDSSGVHLVFDLNERLVARQQRLVLTIPAESRIRRVLELVNVESVVPVVTEVEEAKALARETPARE